MESIPLVEDGRVIEQVAGRGTAGRPFGCFLPHSFCVSLIILRLVIRLPARIVGIARHRDAQASAIARGRKAAAAVISRRRDVRMRRKGEPESPDNGHRQTHSFHISPKLCARKPSCPKTP